MRLDRLLAIIITLLNHDTMTAPQLSKKYGVSVRTIYRDLAAVQAAGVPLVAAAGNQGGYGIMENYRLDRQLLTLSDMAAILAALKGIQTTLPAAEVEQAAEKIGSLVPRDKRDDVDAFNERIAVDMSGWSYSGMRREILRRLYEAVLARRLVRFTYRSLKGEEAGRTVEPMTLLYKGSSWYLYGFCRKRSDYRLFHVGRIKDLETQLTIFKRRPLTLKEFMSRADEPKRLVEIVLKFPVAQKVKVDEFFTEDQISRKGESLFVRGSFPPDEWMYGLILSFGSLCEVVGPPAVRDKMKTIVKNMHSLYQT